MVILTMAVEEEVSVEVVSEDLIILVTLEEEEAEISALLVEIIEEEEAVGKWFALLGSLKLLL